MSLNWQLEKIADYKKVCWKRNRMNVVTEALIWATMHVDMPSITNDYWVEFYRRVHIMEKMTSTMRNKHTKKKAVPVWFEAEEVKQHIGLRTNAQTWSRHQFSKAMLERIWRDTEYISRKYTDEKS